jgi:hypothetical protein
MLANYSMGAAKLYVETPSLDIQDVGVFDSVSVARGLAVGAASSVVGASVQQYILLAGAHALLDAGLGRVFPGAFGGVTRTLPKSIVEIGVGTLGFALGKALMDTTQSE